LARIKRVIRARSAMSGVGRQTISLVSVVMGRIVELLGSLWHATVFGNATPEQAPLNR
jgi:hypothetical protein